MTPITTKNIDTEVNNVYSLSSTTSRDHYQDFITLKSYFQHKLIIQNGLVCVEADLKYSQVKVSVPIRFGWTPATPSTPSQSSCPPKTDNTYLALSRFHCFVFRFSCRKLHGTESPLLSFKRHLHPVAMRPDKGSQTGPFR